MHSPRLVLAAVLNSALLLTGACDRGAPVVVNTLLDGPPADDDLTTLREAVRKVHSGARIVFDPALDGGIIELSIVGEAHTMLPAEVYAGGPPAFQGYQDRDHGASALSARKDVVIDASDLRGGITIRWTGGASLPARVLAVRGDLVLRNVTIAGGFSAAEPLEGGTQPYTLARGGGLAVWGTARLERCTVTGNAIRGDASASRDRGAYGGGIYADGLELVDTVVAGNVASGYGAAGGGIYSVGGAASTGRGNDTSLVRSTVSGNRVTAQHAYGGGIFTLSGGPRNLATMTLTNCTVARNVVEDHPDLPEAGQWYHRGGGIYMGGGSLSLVSTTVAENAVTGTRAEFGGKPNVGGGGLAATIGNAHTVEDVWIRQSILVGNTVNADPEDWFTGSLLFLTSGGYNLVGALDVRHLLVPVPAWNHLSRKHWPKAGDRDEVDPAHALDLANPVRHPSALSTGTDAGEPAVLSYPPGALARDVVPPAGYSIRHVTAGYGGFGGSNDECLNHQTSDDFLNHVVAKLRAEYGATLGESFGADLPDFAGVSWCGPATTWPTEPANAGWIDGWRAIEHEIGGRLGPVILGDEFWERFDPGALGDHLTFYRSQLSRTHVLTATDQSGAARPAGAAGDIGSVER